MPDYSGSSYTPEPYALSPAQGDHAISCFERGLSQEATARKINSPYRSVRNRLDRARDPCRLALVPSSIKRSSPLERKLEAVTHTIARETSTDLTAELGMHTPRLLQRWCELYRAHRIQGLEPRQRGARPVRPSPSRTKRLCSARRTSG